jgi:hypothetical protein
MIETLANSIIIELSCQNNEECLEGLFAGF